VVSLRVVFEVLSGKLICWTTNLDVKNRNCIICFKDGSVSHEPNQCCSLRTSAVGVITQYSLL
jgi:hypothetical protein